MSGVGVSPIYLCSLVTASTVINLVATYDDDPTETAVDTIASRVTQESKQLNGMPGCYETGIALYVALTRKFWNWERNLQGDVVHITTKWLLSHSK